MSDWLPVESAPRDGTNVLLLIGETVPDLPDIRVGSYCTTSEAIDVGYPYAGWLIWNDDCDCFIYSGATHWMPLPEPPKG